MKELSVTQKPVAPPRKETPMLECWRGVGGNRQDGFHTFFGQVPICGQGQLFKVAGPAL